MCFLVSLWLCFKLPYQSLVYLFNYRPSFKILEEWFQMLTFREQLIKLPEPPNLHNVVVSAYSQYNLPLPPNLYHPYLKISTGPQVPRNLHIRPSSPPKSVESDRTPSDTEFDPESVEDNFCSPMKPGVRGTEFFSNSSVTSRL